MPIPGLEMATVTKIHFVRKVSLYFSIPAVTRRLVKR